MSAPPQIALWASRVLLDCLTEAGDDVDAGFAAAEYILSTESESYDYPRNKSNQFLSKLAIAEAARDDAKYKALRDSLPEDQCWKLDNKVATLQGGGTVYHPSENPGLGVNIDGLVVDPRWAEHEANTKSSEEWLAREANRCERRKSANKAVRSFRSEYRPLTRVVSLLKKAGATPSELRALDRIRYDFREKKIDEDKFEKLYEEVIESVHLRIDEECSADPEPKFPDIAFGALDSRGVEHRGGGVDGGQFIARGTDDSVKSAGQSGSSQTGSSSGRKTQLQSGKSEQKPQADPHVAAIREHLESQAHLTPEQQKAYGDAAESVINKMAPGARARLAQNAKNFNWYTDTHTLTSSMARVHKNFADMWSSEKTAGGAYDSNGALHLDGDEVYPTFTVKREELYAHEMTHAIDGPKHEYSNSEGWKAAWAEEIGDKVLLGQKPKLTGYATKNSSEGFAEFGRLAHGTNFDRQAIEMKFPKCVAYWREAGIWE